MVRTRCPPVLLIHPHFRFTVFVTPTSRANTPSVEHKILRTRMAQTGISTDSNILRRGYRSERSGEGTGLKGCWLSRRETSTAFHSLPESLFVLLNLASGPATQRFGLCASNRRDLLNRVTLARQT
jgi:hypothetical protein